MDEEQLIALVEKYPELYDQADPKYCDEQRRNSVWQLIGKTLNETPVECKDKWKKIRDNYRKARNLRKSRGQKAGKMKPIRYGKQLQFLEPYIQKERKRTREDSSSSEEEPAPGSAPASPAGSSGSKSRKRIKAEEAPTSTHFLFQPCSSDMNVHLETDTVVDFFKYLGETVKQFPIDLQVRVKSEVFNIVNLAEAECVQRMN